VAEHRSMFCIRHTPTEVCTPTPCGAHWLYAAAYSSRGLVSNALVGTSDVHAAEHMARLCSTEGFSCESSCSPAEHSDLLPAKVT
jgi:hypothetical protein